MLSKEIKATAKDALAGGFLEILVGNFEWLHSFSGTSRATITHSNMNISKEHSEWASEAIFFSELGVERSQSIGLTSPVVLFLAVQDSSIGDLVSP